MTAYEAYLETVWVWLKVPTVQNKEAIQKAAKAADSTVTMEYVESLLEKLKTGDTGTWLHFLRAIERTSYYDKFKFVSPFKTRILLRVVYESDGTVTLAGDFQHFMDDLIREEGYCIYDGDTYVLSFGPPKNPPVYWLGNSHDPQKTTPLEKDRK